MPAFRFWSSICLYCGYGLWQNGVLTTGKPTKLFDNGILSRNACLKDLLRHIINCHYAQQAFPIILLIFPIWSREANPAQLEADSTAQGAYGGALSPLRGSTPLRDSTPLCGIPSRLITSRSGGGRGVSLLSVPEAHSTVSQWRADITPDHSPAELEPKTSFTEDFAKSTRSSRR